MSEQDPKQTAPPMSARAGVREKDLLVLGGAVALPFLVMGMYITISWWGMGLMGNAGDTLLSYLLPTFGAGLIWLSSLSLRAKIALAMIYIPCMYYCLFLFSLAFVGYVFGDWL
jgi:hypothetical protein